MFSSLVAAFSIALAGGLLLSTLKIQKQTQTSFNNASGGFDAVLGARGREPAPAPKPRAQGELVAPDQHDQ